MMRSRSAGVSGSSCSSMASTAPSRVASDDAGMAGGGVALRRKRREIVLSELVRRLKMLGLGSDGAVGTTGGVAAAVAADVADALALRACTQLAAEKLRGAMLGRAYDRDAVGLSVGTGGGSGTLMLRPWWLTVLDLTSGQAEGFLETC